MGHLPLNMQEIGCDFYVSVIEKNKKIKNKKIKKNKKKKFFF